MKDGTPSVSDAVWIAVVVSLGVTQALQVALLGAMNRARGPAEAAYISILGTLAGLTLALAIRSLMGSRPALPAPFDHPALTGAVALASGDTFGIRRCGGFPWDMRVTGLTAVPYLLAASYLAPEDRGRVVPGGADHRAAWRGRRPRPFWPVGRGDTSHRSDPGLLVSSPCSAASSSCADSARGAGGITGWVNHHSIAGPSVLVDYSTEIKPGIRSPSAAASRPSRCCGRSIARCCAKAATAVLAAIVHRGSGRPLDCRVRRAAGVHLTARTVGARGGRPCRSTCWPAPTRARSRRSIPSRQAIWSRARTELRQNSLRAGRARRASLVVDLFPTPAHAQDADMSTDEFAAFLEAACMLDRPDPVAAWRELSARQAGMIDWLRAARRDPHHRARDRPTAQRCGSVLGQL